jgi:DNA-directed RNA polymerase specialized sigma24 family protein
MSDVTRILAQIDSGDPSAAEQLLPLVYNELRKLAAARLAQEKPGQTLQATALVHEAYIRLVAKPVRGQESGVRDQELDGQPLTPGSCPLTPSFESRGHFFAAAAEAMRRILVESARHRNSQRAGGDCQRVELSDVELATRQPNIDVLALSEALDMLETRDTRKAALVKLRYFVGLTIQEAADALGISTATADNDWAYAKSWLRLQLSGSSSHR